MGGIAKGLRRWRFNSYRGQDPEDRYCNQSDRSSALMLTATADADTGFILLSLIAACTAGAKPLSAGTRSAAGVGLTDSDQVIEQRIGCSIFFFSEREGEDAFRSMEEAVMD